MISVEDATLTKWICGKLGSLIPFLDGTAKLSPCCCNVRVSELVQRNENVFNNLNDVGIIGNYSSTFCFLSSHRTWLYFRKLKWRGVTLFLTLCEWRAEPRIEFRSLRLDPSLAAQPRSFSLLLLAEALLTPAVSKFGAARFYFNPMHSSCNCNYCFFFQWFKVIALAFYHLCGNSVKCWKICCDAGGKCCVYQVIITNLLL